LHWPECGVAPISRNRAFILTEALRLARTPVAGHLAVSYRHVARQDDADQLGLDLSALGSFLLGLWPRPIISVGLQKLTTSVSLVPSPLPLALGSQPEGLRSTGKGAAGRDHATLVPGTPMVVTRVVVRPRTQLERRSR
jgi:hypothetical protein